MTHRDDTKAGARSPGSAARGASGGRDAVFARDARGRFAPGNPGRPFGTRNRVSRRVARALLADFEANQATLLPRLRRWFLPQYLHAVSRLLPRDGKADGPELEALDATEVARLVADARAALDRIEAGEAGLGELEAALLGEAPARAGTDIIGDYR